MVPNIFDLVILDLKGQPLKWGEDTLTVKFAVVTALLNSFPGEQIDGDEKARRYRLAKAINDGTDELTSPDAALIKELVGKTFGPPVVGPVFEAFADLTYLKKIRA